MLDIPVGPKAEAAHTRMISAMRLILAAMALLIIHIDPSEPERYVALAYTTLVLYTIYGAAIYGLVLIGAKLTATLHRWAHWADIVWCLILIGLSSGTNSIFFIYLFFPVSVASNRWGFKTGMWVAATSAIPFAIVGYATAPQAAY